MRKGAHALISFANENDNHSPLYNRYLDVMLSGYFCGKRSGVLSPYINRVPLFNSKESPFSGNFILRNPLSNMCSIGGGVPPYAMNDLRFLINDLTGESDGRTL